MAVKARRASAAGDTPLRNFRIPDDEWLRDRVATVMTGTDVSKVARKALNAYADQVGDVLDTIGFGSPELPERFWEKVAQMPDGCWVWMATTFKNGEGVYTVNGHKERAHKYAFSALVGGVTLPDGYGCPHSPGCIRPSHMTKGAQPSTSG